MHNDESDNADSSDVIANDSIDVPHPSTPLIILKCHPIDSASFWLAVVCVLIKVACKADVLFIFTLFLSFKLSTELMR